MSRSGRRDWRTIGCAAVIGASIAFPAGLIVGARETLPETDRGSRRSGSSSAETPAARDVYSPRIRSDPYVLEEQRKVLRALEAGCRQLKQHCAEAEQARRRIEEAEAER